MKALLTGGRSSSAVQMARSTPLALATTSSVRLPGSGASRSMGRQGAAGSCECLRSACSKHYTHG